jgi:hypothetical protein
MAFLIESVPPTGFVVRLLGPSRQAAGVGVLVGLPDLAVVVAGLNSTMAREPPRRRPLRLGG